MPEIMYMMITEITAMVRQKQWLQILMNVQSFFISMIIEGICQH